MRRRVQIQPNNVGRLLLKIRIIRGHVAFYVVRLKAVLTPHPCHHHVADLQMRSEFARAPVGYSTRRCVSRRLQNPRFQFRCQHGSDLPQMAAVESRDALLGKSSAPTSDKTPAAVDALRHFIPGMPFGQQQDQPCPPGIFGPSRPLKEGGRSGGSAGSHNRVRNALVVAQVAVSLLLLAGAGFFVRSFENSAHTDMGFRVDHTLMASMDLRLQNYTEQRGQQFYEQLRDRVKGHPGVRDAAIAALIPMGYDANTVNVYAEGQAATDKSKGEIIFCNSVQPEYFRTLGVRLVRGREFTELDNASAPRVAIVNEAFARKMFRGQDPLGKTFQTERSGPKTQIVGVAVTGKYMFLYEPPQPFIYFPLAQKYQSSATLLVYSDGDPQGMVGAVREETQQLDSTLPLYDVTTMDSHVRYGKPL